MTDTPPLWVQQFKKKGGNYMTWFQFEQGFMGFCALCRDEQNIDKFNALVDVFLRSLLDRKIKGWSEETGDASGMVNASLRSRLIRDIKQAEEAVDVPAKWWSQHRTKKPATVHQYRNQLMVEMFKTPARMKGQQTWPLLLQKINSLRKHGARVFSLEWPSCKNLFHIAASKNNTQLIHWAMGPDNVNVSHLRDGVGLDRVWYDNYSMTTGLHHPLVVAAKSSSFETVKMMLQYEERLPILIKNDEDLLPPGVMSFKEVEAAFVAAASKSRINVIASLFSDCIIRMDWRGFPYTVDSPFDIVGKTCKLPGCTHKNCNRPVVKLLIELGYPVEDEQGAVYIKMCPPEIKKLKDDMLDDVAACKLTLAMSLHPRLGETSPMNVLDAGVLGAICDTVFRYSHGNVMAQTQSLHSHPQLAKMPHPDWSDG
jgi:hypothetical protein